MLNFKKIKWGILFAIVMCFFCINIKSITISAQETSSLTIATSESEELEEEEPSEESSSLFEGGYAIEKNEMEDENLYVALLNLFKIDNPSYTSSYIYSNMFKNYTSLNLDKIRSGLVSLQGLELLELDNLVSFSANLNKLTKFDPVYFQHTKPENFRSLSLAGNQFTSIDLSELKGLYDINLSSNQLTQIDLSHIEGEDGGNTKIKINLAGNLISSMDKIKLPGSNRISNIELNLISNNIITIEDKYFSEGFSLKLGIQGCSTSEEIAKLDSKTNLKIYKSYINNLSVKVYKIDGTSDVLVAHIKDSEIADKFVSLNLGVGKYRYDYYIGEGESIEKAYDANNIDRKYLTSHKFNIIPQPVKIVYSFKNKDYENYSDLGKVTGIVTIKLSTPEDAEIRYQVNGGNWITGDTISCNKGGNYNIKVKAVIGDYESEVQDVWVKTSLNLYIPDILMLILVLLLALTLFLVVLPIISKKYFKKD